MSVRIVTEKTSRDEKEFQGSAASLLWGVARVARCAFATLRAAFTRRVSPQKATTFATGFSSLSSPLWSLACALLLSIFCGLWPAASGLLYAQTETATISGLITDDSGAMVVGADVQLLSVQQGTTLNTKTNSAGLYIFPNVQPGMYQIKVNQRGFKQVDILSLIVNVQDHVEQNVRLQVGSVSESVTVNANDVHINTTDAAVSTVIDRASAESLPLNGRSFNTLLQLTPGVVIAPSNANSPGQFSISGQRTNANYFSVDGVGANFGINSNNGLQQAGAGGSQALNAYGGTNSLVSVDALQEFRIQTSTFAPEFGRTPGGQVIIRTRSGTNDFHGVAFDYFRNDVLDANDWFANRAGLPRATDRQNDFGGVVGGPIAHDRTFFFFSYEGLRLRQPHTVGITVPSLGVRSAAIAAVAPFIDAYPVPNGTDFGDGTAQFTGNFSNRITGDTTSLRLDHQIGKTLSIFGRYNYAPSTVASRSSFQAERDVEDFSTKTLTVGADWFPTFRLSNSFRFNYSTQDAGQTSVLDSFGGGTPPSSTTLLPTPLSPAISGGAFFPGDIDGYTFGHISKNHVTQFNVVENTALSLGTHHLKFGFDYNALRLQQENPQPDVLYELPSTIQDFANNGMSDVAVIANRTPKALFQAASIYAQDTWNIGRKATITYGLRWEFAPVPVGLDGTVLTSWVNVNNPAAIALAPAGSPPWKTRYDNFAPRVGLAYQLTANGDLVLRAGWGIFYDLGTGLAPSLMNQFPNTAANTTFGQTLPLSNIGPLIPPFSLQPPFPGNVIDGFSQDLSLPYSYQWNVALEKSFGGKQAVSLTYVAQVGRALLRQEVIPKPNPNFTGVFDLTLNGDTSDYSAFQVQYRRPLHRRLQALLNYTWSHSIDTNSSDASFVLVDSILSKNLDRGSSSFDVRHNFSGALTYDVPSIGRKGFVSQLSRDWSLASVIQTRTGFPINVTTRRVPIPGLGFVAKFLVSERPDVVSGQSFWIADPNSPGGKRLNINAFVLQTQPRQGSLGRNSIRGFGASQVDFSLARRIRFTEAINLRFQADLFNILNHPNFANPPSSIDSPGSFGVANQMLNQGLSGGGFGLSPLYQFGGPRSIQLSLKLAF